jgi:two-component system LytT family response regulator
MKTLLVDDEPLARRELRRLLAPYPWIEIVGEASHVDEAEERIHALAPELLFLDIEMPGGTGFDLLARLDLAPRVVFTTAHDEHAVRAFEVAALDYLLKPIEPERLAAALARLPGGARAASTAPSVPAAPLQQLFVRDGARCWFVPLRDVRLLAAEGNYVRVVWGTEQPLLGRSLVALEPHLDPQRFFRANRHQIVNLDHVDQVEMGAGGRLVMALRGGPEIELSRRQTRIFRARMAPPPVVAKKSPSD